MVAPPPAAASSSGARRWRRWKSLEEKVSSAVAVRKPTQAPKRARSNEDLPTGTGAEGAAKAAASKTADWSCTTIVLCMYVLSTKHLCILNILNAYIYIYIHLLIGVIHVYVYIYIYIYIYTHTHTYMDRTRT